jgi:hypothetical protein
MKVTPTTVIFMGVGTCISCLLVGGILFLISEYVPLGRFYLWCGLTLSTLWSVVAWFTLVEATDKDLSLSESSIAMVNGGLSAVSMCSFGYLVFS